MATNQSYLDPNAILGLIREMTAASKLFLECQRATCIKNAKDKRSLKSLDKQREKNRTQLLNNKISHNEYTKKDLEIRAKEQEIYSHSLDNKCKMESCEAELMTMFKKYTKLIETECNISKDSFSCKRLTQARKVLELNEPKQVRKLWDTWMSMK